MSPNVVAGLGAQHALASSGAIFVLAHSLCVCAFIVSAVCLCVCEAGCVGAAGRGRVWKRHASSNQQND